VQKLQEDRSLFETQKEKWKDEQEQI